MRVLYKDMRHAENNKYYVSLIILIIRKVIMTLEGSDTKEDAQEVHNKWLEILDRDNYDELYDCYENYTYKKFK